MKAWAERHPNLMVLWFGALSFYSSWLVGESPEWWQKAVWLVLCLIFMGDARRWYHRTGRQQ